jgi:hypothetical protein
MEWWYTHREDTVSLKNCQRETHHSPESQTWYLFISTFASLPNYPLRTYLFTSSCATTTFSTASSTGITSIYILILAPPIHWISTLHGPPSLSFTSNARLRPRQRTSAALHYIQKYVSRRWCTCVTSLAARHLLRRAWWHIRVITPEGGLDGSHISICSL